MPLLSPHTIERSNDNFCHSERSEESLIYRSPRFFTPMRSVQNDMTFLVFDYNIKY